MILLLGEDKNWKIKRTIFVVYTREYKVKKNNERSSGKRCIFRIEVI